MAQSSGGWWADDPIADPGADLFGRSAFVERAASLLGQIGTGASSTVVGLVGPWGSGKTSSLKMIERRLDATGGWSVTWMNPWALAGPEAVVAELLGAIHLAIPNEPGAADRARRSLERYGAFAAPLLSAVPVVGGVLEAISTEAVERITAKGTLQEQAQKVAGALRELARPILVVIDDVDRLQPDQLLAVFRAVRVLGRLPHVHYVLAYDQQTLLDVLGATAIADQREARAVAFLEKVVTLRLEQPPIRSQHAEALFDTRLRDALEATSAAMTEEARGRLLEECETFVLRVATEPRSVARLITQIHIYLPLIGPSEVDVVDFIVLTLLRLGYPRLYQALAADRRLLVGSDGSEARDSFDSAKLRELAVPESDVPRVEAALQRLFPLLAGGARVGVDARERGRQRRVSDPDCVDRYFALAPLEGETPDRVIAEALQELAHGRSGASTDALVAALRLDPADGADDGRTARTLRRAAVLCDDLSDPQCLALLPFLARYLPDLGSPVHPSFEPEVEAVAWLATIFGRIGKTGMAPQDVVRLFEAEMPLLLRALKLAFPFYAMDVHASNWAEPQRYWNYELVRTAGVAAWQHIVAHVSLGDDAPRERVAYLFSWLEELVGAAEVGRLMRGVLDGGSDLADLAARRVEVATAVSDRSRRIEGFDAAAFLRDVGRWRAVRYEALRPEPATVDEPDPLDLSDDSWANRRRYALRQLRHELTRDAELPLVPDLNSAISNVWHRRWLPPISDQPADLALQVTFLIPLAGALPEPGDDGSGPAAAERDRQVLDVLERSAVSRWLRGQAAHVAAAAGAWTIVDTGDRQSTCAELSLAVDRRPAVVLRAQLRTGEAPSMLLTVGIDIRAAGAEAAPGPPRPDSVLDAGKMRLEALYEMAHSLVRCDDAARSLWLHFTGTSAELDGVAAVLKLATGGPLAGVVDLARYERPTHVAGREFFTSFRVPYPQASATLDDVVAAALRRWLSGDVVEDDYAEVLTTIWNERALSR